MTTKPRYIGHFDGEKITDSKLGKPVYEINLNPGEAVLLDGIYYVGPDISNIVEALRHARELDGD
jgi:hypothetical protein